MTMGLFRKTEANTPNKTSLTAQYAPTSMGENLNSLFNSLE